MSTVIATIFLSARRSAASWTRKNLREDERATNVRDGAHHAREKNTPQLLKMMSTISNRSHSQSAYRLTARGRHAGTSSFNASKYPVGRHASRKACVVRAEKVVGIDLGTTNSAVGII